MGGPVLFFLCVLCVLCGHYFGIEYPYFAGPEDRLSPFTSSKTVACTASLEQRPFFEVLHDDLAHAAVDIRIEHLSRPLSYLSSAPISVRQPRDAKWIAVGMELHLEVLEVDAVRFAPNSNAPKCPRTGSEPV